MLLTFLCHFAAVVTIFFILSDLVWHSKFFLEHRVRGAGFIGHFQRPEGGGWRMEDGGQDTVG